MIELSFPVPTPSANQLWGHHWSRKARERKKWGWMVRGERLRLQKLGALPERVSLPAVITIDRYGARMLDQDNAVSGMKWLIDALVAEGFLVDDSPSHLQATYRQHVGKPYRTVVTIA